ncbi:MAG: zf-HC2 domain-containing protein [Armatimonadetes bacterium]|nr:zf-HC2 domain-containing protein [Armatimonadota bacterium]
MNCKLVREMMGAYLYGDLAPEEMKEVRLHTQECPECRKDVESRGRIIAAIPCDTPELSDEERMQIAWSVKGAIRNCTVAQEGFRWGYVAAIATVALAALAVAGIVVYNSSKQPSSIQAKRRPVPVVRIQEEPIPPGPEPTMKTERQARTPASPHQSPELEREPSTPSPRLRNIERQLGTIATIARHEHRKRNVAAEKPVPVVEEPETNTPVPPEEGTKLPRPTDPNDAQIAPQ